MIVTLISDLFGSVNNGTGHATMNLYSYLVEQGHTVRVVCCDQTKKGQENFYVTKVKSFFPLNFIIYANNVLLCKAEKKVLYEAIKGSDIVHIMVPFQCGGVAAKIANELNIPVTAGFHVQAENVTSHFGHLMNCRWANHLQYKYLNWRCFQYVDAIHYPTNFIHRIFVTNTYNNKPAYIISNGVNSQFKKLNIDREEPFKDKFNVLFIGRYSKEKSHYLLLKAVAASKYKDNIRIIFAGQGPRTKQILKLAKKLDIKNLICEFYNLDEIVKVINQCDLYVHCSPVEIEAIACLEAITSGLVPVINNSDKSATVEFALDDNNLFKYNDPMDLAKKIDFWYGNPKIKEEYAKKYSSFRYDVDQQACMAKMVDMFNEVIKNKKDGK